MSASCRSWREEDLKEIGVGPVGHRRIILEAIAALGASTKTEALPSTQEPSSAATASDSPAAKAVSVAEATGERRHVTVMFRDLVDSTDYSSAARR